MLCNNQFLVLVAGYVISAGALYGVAFRMEKRDKDAAFLIAAFGSMLLPWVWIVFSVLLFVDLKVCQ